MWLWFWTKMWIWTSPELKQARGTWTVAAATRRRKNSAPGRKAGTSRVKTWKIQKFHNRTLDQDPWVWHQVGRRVLFQEEKQPVNVNVNLSSNTKTQHIIFNPVHKKEKHQLQLRNHKRVSEMTFVEKIVCWLGIRVKFSYLFANFLHTIENVPQFSKKLFVYVIFIHFKLMVPSFYLVIAPSYLCNNPAI